MKLLILGGSGFVSRFLAKEALARGHQVWTLTRGNRPSLPGVRCITADRNDAAALASALECAGTKWDAALDCICYRPEQARCDLDILPRFTGRLIVISTDSVYLPGPIPMDETFDGCLRDDSYGGQKRQMELTFQASPAAGLDWTIFRPPHIYGPGSRLGCYPMHTRQPDLAQRIQAGEPVLLVDGGEYRIQPVYVGDLVRAMLDTIPNEKTFGQIFCIAGPEVITNREYFEILGTLLGVEVRVESVPRAQFDAQFDNGYQFFRDRIYDMTKLKNADLPLPETTLREGLSEQLSALG